MSSFNEALKQLNEFDSVDFGHATAHRPQNKVVGTHINLGNNAHKDDNVDPMSTDETEAPVVMPFPFQTVMDELVTIIATGTDIKAKIRLATGTPSTLNQEKIETLKELNQDLSDLGDLVKGMADKFDKFRLVGKDD